MVVEDSLISSIVNTNREPSNSSIPVRVQLTLYSRVSCLPIILIVWGRSFHSFSTFSGFLVMRRDLRLFIRYLIATFLCTWPSTGICSFPISIVNDLLTNAIISKKPSIEKLYVLIIGRIYVIDIHTGFSWIIFDIVI